MPVTDYQHQGTSSPFLSIGRSILSIRRDQVPSMDGVTVASDGSHDLELESFQRQVADLFHDLDAGDDEVLSLMWIRKLLETFIVCQEEFRSIVLKSKSSLSRPPVDRMVSEFFERSVKALDVCNAIRDGIDQVRTWSKHLEIVDTALNTNGRAVGEAHFRRAKKALTDLTIAMLDEKDSSSSVISQQRNRSFGRRSRFGNNGHFRSLSWSVSRNWSAARQLQMIGNNLTAPRNNEIVATNGLAVPIFTMNSVLLFVMWALVAAIPCQDRGLQAHFSIPRGFIWAAPFMALHDRILEESKKRGRKNSNGLLKEIHQIEKCGRHLLELVDSAEFPLSDEKELKIKEEVQELALVCDVMKEGLEPLERQVREVFHRIVRSRMEGLDSLGHA